MYRKKGSSEATERRRVRRLAERRREAERRRRSDEDEIEQLNDDDEIDEWSGSTDDEELVGALERIEEYRRGLDSQRRYFNSILDADPDLQARWVQFLRAGGVTAAELRQFLDGKVNRLRATRLRRHLRMVVNNQRRPVRAPNGNEAA